MTAYASNLDAAISDLKDWIDEQLELGNEPEDEAHDIIFELADGAVPIYTADLLEAALDNLWLAAEQPEILAWGGEPTATNCIAGNIFQDATNELWEALREYVKEKRDEEEEDDTNE